MDKNKKPSVTFNVIANKGDNGAHELVLTFAAIEILHMLYPNVFYYCEEMVESHKTPLVTSFARNRKDIDILLNMYNPSRDTNIQFYETNRITFEMLYKATKKARSFLNDIPDWQREIMTFNSGVYVRSMDKHLSA